MFIQNPKMGENMSEQPSKPVPAHSNTSFLDEPIPRRGTIALRVGVLVVLLVLGFMFQHWAPSEPAELLRLAEQTATHPGFVVGTTVGMAALFTVGGPGTIGMWMLAPFHPPWSAVLFLTAGSVAGAAGAYTFSAWLGGAKRRHRQSNRMVRLLRDHGGLTTQVALRMLPGFPQQVISFSAGLLRLPRARFLAAAAIGHSIKWAVYGSALYGVTGAVAAGEALDLTRLLPLVGLTALMLAAAIVRGIRQDASDDAPADEAPYES